MANVDIFQIDDDFIYIMQNGIFARSKRPKENIKFQITSDPWFKLLTVLINDHFIFAYNVV